MNRTSFTRMAVLVALACALLIPVAPAFAAAPNPVVSGTLRGSDGVAIGDGQVAVSQQVRGIWRPVITIPTGANGTWSFSAKAGSYRFEFSAGNADVATRDLSTVRQNTYQLDVTLQAYGTLGGTITDSGTGLALAGASVTLYRQNADGTWAIGPSLTTGADGSYASAQIAAGTWTAKASAAGYYEGYYGGGDSPGAAQPIAVSRGTNADATFGLAAVPPPTGNGTISGWVVRYATRTPIAGAYVYIYKQNDDGTWPPTSPGWGQPFVTVYADSTGRYTSGQLPLGNYKIRFFDVHIGAQWWQYVPTVDLASVIPITYDGQAYDNIDGWYNKP